MFCTACPTEQICKKNPNVLLFSSGCPSEQPQFGSSCSISGETQCSYGEECCCDQCHPRYVCHEICLWTIIDSVAIWGICERMAPLLNNAFSAWSWCVERAVGLVITLMLASDPIVRGTQVLNILKKRCLYEREKCGYGAFIWKSDIALNEMIRIGWISLIWMIFRLGWGDIPQFR